MLKKLTDEKQLELLDILKTRFENNKKRHENLEWSKIQAKLESNIQKLETLHEMEITGGEPDVVAYEKTTDTYIFYDCSAESPSGRRSLCYDDEALKSRKENKPKSSAEAMARQMGIALLNENEYRYLQQFGNFDTKTSSWLKTPDGIRNRGGAIFGDFRYDSVFIYHNGAESYYAARGFRGSLRV
ncbi:MAG: DUF4256 domain-containing protein [Confluentibacter sp.]|nr:DUF4256 domain-containing protein [Confluentibacter sp.]